MSELPVTTHKCVVCRAEVSGPTDGFAFGAQGRLLFVTCHEHAPVVRAGLVSARKLAIKGLERLIERKAPTFWGLLQQFRKEHTA